MKNYSVLVETDDWITVDAEDEESAKDEAIRIAERDLTHDWKATVMNEAEIDE
jgi:hypothetical protein